MLNVALRYNASADEDQNFGLYENESFSVATEESMERLCALREQETQYNSLSTDYLRLGKRMQKCCGSSSKTRVEAKPTAIDIDEECIATMSQWWFEVVDHYGFSRETAQVALGCLHRFLSTKAGTPFLISRPRYQLASMACLYIAIKVHERVELEASAFVLLSRSSYSVSDIFATERKVLTALKWKVNPPTASSIVRQIVRLLAGTTMAIVSMDTTTMKSIYNLALHQTEIASCIYQLSVDVRPSVIAVASVWNAVQLHSNGRTSFSVDQAFYSTLAMTLGVEFFESEVLSSSQQQLLRRILKRTEVDAVEGKDGLEQSSCRTTLAKTYNYNNRNSHSPNNLSSPVAVVSPK